MSPIYYISTTKIKQRKLGTKLRTKNRTWLHMLYSGPVCVPYSIFGTGLNLILMPVSTCLILASPTSCPIIQAYDCVAWHRLVQMQNKFSRGKGLCPIRVYFTSICIFSYPDIYIQLRIKTFVMQDQDPVCSS